MAESATLARPYAKAVFDLARDEGKSGTGRDAAGGLADWSALLAGLADAVTDPKIAQWIGHPAIGRGQLAEVLIKACGAGLSLSSQNLLRLLSENNRLKLAPVIAGQFETLRAEAERRVEVEITSAAVVPEAQRLALTDAIRQRLERDVSVEWKTNPELIAGAVVRAGDLVIDGSLTSELAQLRHALTA